jgi:hypothetical protein
MAAGRRVCPLPGFPEYMKLRELQGTLQPAPGRQIEAVVYPPPHDPLHFPDLAAITRPPSEDHLPPSRAVVAARSAGTVPAAAVVEAADSGRGGLLAGPFLLVPNPTQKMTSFTPGHGRGRNRLLPRYTARAMRRPPQGSIPRRTGPIWLLNLRTLRTTRSLASVRANSQQIARQTSPVRSLVSRRVLAVEPICRAAQKMTVTIASRSLPFPRGIRMLLQKWSALVAIRKASGHLIYLRRSP